MEGVNVLCENRSIDDYNDDDNDDDKYDDNKGNDVEKLITKGIKKQAIWL